MSFTAAEWLGDYEEAKGFAVKLRTHGGGAQQPSRAQVSNLEQAVDRLDFRLGSMEQDPRQFGITESEAARRRELVKGLRKQVTLIQSGATSSGGGAGAGGGNAGASSGGASNLGPRTLQQQRRDILSEQDELLEDLGKGVDRLKQQGLAIRDETTLHKRLLDDIDTDVEAAASSLRLEARHAQRIREQSTVCRLYLCIAILVIILVLLLVLGFT